MPQTARAFPVTFPADMSSSPLDGRLILLISRDFTREPRTHVEANEPLDSPYLFGMNVAGWSPGATVIVNDKAFGWPAARLSAMPTGDYSVQIVLNRYEEFHLADGRVLKLPPDQGEGQHWESKPGNLYSKPLRVHIDRTHPAATAMVLDQKMPALPTPADTEFVKHIKIRSELLSKFWGRDMCLGAHILLPKGFETHPEAHYPLMVFHGHFPDDISEFRTEPPDPNLKPDYSTRFHLAGYNRIQQQEAYSFYQKWTSADFPRFLVVEIQHANPYYDDIAGGELGQFGSSMAMPSTSETHSRKSRSASEDSRRAGRDFTYGRVRREVGRALATQVFYPDMYYNGAFAACPDPTDFRAYTVIDLYKDPNAYTLKGEAASVERPAFRNYLGEVFATQRDRNYMEIGDRR